MFLVFAVLLVLDIYLLFNLKDGLVGKRMMTEKFSNSDENPVLINLRNQYRFKIFIKVIDELPFQFQKRDFGIQTEIDSLQEIDLEYQLRPVERGEYEFGRLQVFVSSPFRLLSRRFTLSVKEKIAVYPSFIQMRKYEFLAISNKLNAYGLKKIRRIGHTMEFEQINEYVLGDDIRTINWNATAKHAKLMVNQYQDEKSQPIYSLIDTGRLMKMPFDGLKLLDYAINSTLAFSNIALRKNDKAGMLTFSKTVENTIAASNKKTHLNIINEALYAVDTNFSESDFSLLYTHIKRKLSHRSLLMLYTNFEHINGMRRQLPSIMALSKLHLLVVVFFENTELEGLINTNSEDIEDVYHKAIAENFANEKQLIVKELQARGVHCILTKPQSLTLNVINTYLEFKAKGLI
ncbi:DUF58 domain-containing protein [Urechidicola sp. KH5]